MPLMQETRTSGACGHLLHEPLLFLHAAISTLRCSGDQQTTAVVGETIQNSLWQSILVSEHMYDDIS